MIYTESVIYQLTASPAIVPSWKIYAKALTFVDTICDKKKNGKKNNSLRLHCSADCRPSELITQSSTPIVWTKMLINASYKITKNTSALHRIKWNLEYLLLHN